MGSLPTAEQIRTLLDYNKETGAIKHLNRVAGHKDVGDDAGWIEVCGRGKNEYRRIRIGGAEGKVFYAHALVWLHVTGEWPKKQISFKDGDGLNLRWSNLKEQARPNKTGVPGVKVNDGRISARICIGGGRRLFLGTFESVANASECYQLAVELRDSKNR